MDKSMKVKGAVASPTLSGKAPEKVLHDFLHGSDDVAEQALEVMMSGLSSQNWLNWVEGGVLHCLLAKLQMSMSSRLSGDILKCLKHLINSQPDVQCAVLVDYLRNKLGQPQGLVHVYWLLKTLSDLLEGNQTLAKACYEGQLTDDLVATYDQLKYDRTDHPSTCLSPAGDDTRHDLDITYAQAYPCSHPLSPTFDLEDDEEVLPKWKREERKISVPQLDLSTFLQAKDRGHEGAKRSFHGYRAPLLVSCPSAHALASWRESGENTPRIAATVGSDKAPGDIVLVLLDCLQQICQCAGTLSSGIDPTSRLISDLCMTPEELGEVLLGQDHVPKSQQKAFYACFRRKAIHVLVTYCVSRSGLCRKPDPVLEVLSGKLKDESSKMRKTTAVLNRVSDLLDLSLAYMRGLEKVALPGFEEQIVVASAAQLADMCVDVMHTVRTMGRIMYWSKAGQKVYDQLLQLNTKLIHTSHDGGNEVGAGCPKEMHLFHQHLVLTLCSRESLLLLNDYLVLLYESTRVTCPWNSELQEGGRQACLSVFWSYLMALLRLNGDNADTLSVKGHAARGEDGSTQELMNFVSTIMSLTDNFIKQHFEGTGMNPDIKLMVLQVMERTCSISGVSMDLLTQYLAFCYQQSRQVYKMLKRGTGRQHVSEEFKGHLMVILTIMRRCQVSTWKASESKGIRRFVLWALKDMSSRLMAESSNEGSHIVISTQASVISMDTMDNEMMDTNDAQASTGTGRVLKEATQRIEEEPDLGGSEMFHANSCLLQAENNKTMCLLPELVPRLLPSLNLEGLRNSDSLLTVKEAAALTSRQDSPAADLGGEVDVGRQDLAGKPAPSIDPSNQHCAEDHGPSMYQLCGAAEERSELLCEPSSLTAAKLDQEGVLQAEETGGAGIDAMLSGEERDKAGSGRDPYCLFDEDSDGSLCCASNGDATPLPRARYPMLPCLNLNGLRKDEVVLRTPDTPITPEQETSQSGDVTSSGESGAGRAAEDCCSPDATSILQFPDSGAIQREVSESSSSLKADMLDPEELPHDDEATGPEVDAIVSGEERDKAGSGRDPYCLFDEDSDGSSCCASDGDATPLPRARYPMLPCLNLNGLRKDEAVLQAPDTPITPEPETGGSVNVSCHPDDCGGMADEEYWTPDVTSSPSLAECDVMQREELERTPCISAAMLDQEGVLQAEETGGADIDAMLSGEERDKAGSGRDPYCLFDEDSDGSSCCASDGDATPLPQARYPMLPCLNLIGLRKDEVVLRTPDTPISPEQETSQSGDVTSSGESCAGRAAEDCCSPDATSSLLVKPAHSIKGEGWMTVMMNTELPVCTLFLHRCAVFFADSWDITQKQLAEAKRQQGRVLTRGPKQQAMGTLRYQVDVFAQASEEDNEVELSNTRQTLGSGGGAAEPCQPGGHWLPPSPSGLGEAEPWSPRPLGRSPLAKCQLAEPCSQGMAHDSSSTEEVLIELCLRLTMGPDANFHPSLRPFDPTEGRLKKRLVELSDVLSVPSLAEPVKKVLTSLRNTQSGGGAGAEVAGGLIRLLKLSSSTLVETKVSLVTRIARGSFGDVYTGIAMQDPHREVVVKHMQARVEDFCFTAKVFQEVEVMERLRGVPGTVPLLDFGRGRDHLYLILPRYDCSLKVWRMKLGDENALAFKWCLLIFQEVLKRVRILHANKVIHFDLKGDNILLKSKEGKEAHMWMLEDGTLPFEIALTDFGDSRCYDDRQSAYTHRNHGTEAFQSPEMLMMSHGTYSSTHNNFDRRKQKGAGVAHDVWSLGCLLFELATGHVLFTSLGNHGQTASDAAVLYRVAHGQGPLLNEYEKGLLGHNPLAVQLLEYILVRDEIMRPSVEEVTSKVRALLMGL